mmetsp:Transcript_35575/g.58948  ORF Transcript_35575/g.58948 Transcript_35575/m.58948 type:complete len:152 (-) Transcript_35575:2-457(-)
MGHHFDRNVIRGYVSVVQLAALDEEPDREPLSSLSPNAERLGSSKHQEAQRPASRCCLRESPETESPNVLSRRAGGDGMEVYRKGHVSNGGMEGARQGPKSSTLEQAARFNRQALKKSPATCDTHGMREARACFVISERMAMLQSATKARS